MDGHASNVSPSNLDLTNVDTGTNLHAQRAYRCHNCCCTVDRSTRAAEDSEKSVTDGINLSTAKAPKLLTNDAVVAIQEIVPPSVPERRGTFRRADDVGEKDRYHQPVKPSATTHTGDELLDLVKQLSCVANPIQLVSTR